MELKRLDRRRRHTSARQRAHLVERFQSSGLTRIAFARRCGMGLSTLGKWLSEARAASPRPSPVDLASGLLVAPVMYSDNYFSLPPGETKLVSLDFGAKEVSGIQAMLMVEGWNVTPAELARVGVGHTSR